MREMLAQGSKVNARILARMAVDDHDSRRPRCGFTKSIRGKRGGRIFQRHGEYVSVPRKCRTSREHSIVRRSSPVATVFVVLYRGVGRDEAELVHASFDVHARTPAGCEEEHVIQRPQRTEQRIAKSRVTAAGVRICFTDTPGQPTLCRRRTQMLHLVA